MDDLTRKAHETIYKTLSRSIETMDMPASYRASVSLRIIADLDAAGICINAKKKEQAK